MKKALYLALVFSLPAITTLIPIHELQVLLVWLYVPFAVIYATCVWFSPNKNMMILVTLTPLFFLVASLIVILGFLVFELGFLTGLHVFLVVILVAVISALFVGPVYVLLAYGIFAFFRRYGLLPANS